MTEAAKAEPPAEEALPKRFGKYTLLRRLALGGMAELFLALQKSVAGFEKLIVVKRVLPGLAQDKAFVEMLLQEARIAATLTHPNIAQVYDVGFVDGDYYIAMEHVHGEDLRSIVRQMKKKQERSFPLEHALSIVLGCCKGLAYAHEKRDLDGNPLQIVHRDISPQNVLVTFTGDVQLVDFGIAKASTNADEDGTKLKGKVPYMSPEQAQGLELDARSDIFSLGVLLFELCTGKRLFKGKDESETLQFIVDGNYPTPRSLNPNLDPELERIIQKALAPELDDRYGNARAMQAELEAFIREKRLVVSPLDLGEWMQHLFDEKLAQQKEMLAEGRQLAEVLAAQAPASDEFSLSGHSVSDLSLVREKPSKTPWVLLMTVLGIAIAGGIAAWYLWPESAPTGPGIMVLQSEPEGAAIWIDGARREERTPAMIQELPLGTYEVRLTAEGFVPYTQSVEITEAAPQVEISGVLERPTADSYGVVQLRTTPEGASALLDGRPVEGTSPLTIAEIEPGAEHTLVITLDGYQPITQTLLMEAGEVRPIQVTLDRTPLADDEALLILTTDPEATGLELDGTEYEGPYPIEIRTTAGSHRLVATRDGYRQATRNLDLPGGEITELEVELERDRRPGGMTMVGMSGGSGQLTFDARPWCNVTIDGRSVGQTPIVNRTLPAGSHRIGCVNPDLNENRTITVQINDGETTRRRINLR